MRSNRDSMLPIVIGNRPEPSIYFQKENYSVKSGWQGEDIDEMEIEKKTRRLRSLVAGPGDNFRGQNNS